MGLNYERMKYFLQAAETQNFSEAARQAHITPQAFGKQIALLEDEIGMQLFHRQGHKKLLTAEGEIVYRHMSQMIEALENEYEVLRMMGQKNKGNFNVGFLTFLPREVYISPMINELFKYYDKQNISIRIYEMPELGKAIAAKELDFALALLPSEMPYSWEGYDFMVLDRRYAKAAISLYNPRIMKDELTVEDLLEMDKIRFQLPLDETDDPYPAYPCRAEHIVDNFATMLSMLESEDAYTLMVPEWSNLHKEYHVAYREMPEPKMEFSIYLLYRSSLKSDTLTNLLDDVADYFET